MPPDAAAPEPERPLVSVVIPVYDDVARLARCLEALRRQTCPPERFEVIVVDNGANPGIEALAGEAPGVRLTREPKPGAYAARNRGIGLARGRLLAFTDADCLPAPDWLERGAAHFEARPEIGVLAGRIELTFRRPGRPNAAERFEWITEFRQQEYVECYRYGATANVFSPARLFDELGPFDDHVMSWSDQLWGERVSAAGYPVVYADDVVVRHPARHSLLALGRKRARTVGGFHDLHHAQGYGLSALVRDVFRTLRAPFTAHPADELRGKADTRLHRLQFFGVRFWLALWASGAHVRFWLGRPSERR